MWGLLTGADCYLLSKRYYNLVTVNYDKNSGAQAAGAIKLGNTVEDPKNLDPGEVDTEQDTSPD